MDGSDTPAGSPGPQSAFSVTLRQAAGGDQEARRQLWADNYELFQQCAAKWFQRSWNQRENDNRISLCATDIVDEVFLRLVDRTAAMANGRQFFFRAFYNECLRVAVDHYRKVRRHKEGRADLESRFLRDEKLDTNLDVLAESIDRLEKHDPRMGQVARLRVFDHRPDENQPGGVRSLTTKEIAEIVGVSTRTIESDWRFAKAYLINKIQTGS